MGASLGWSRRSLTRHFRNQTGMSVVEWRQIARLQKGMALLNGFIALFRRTLGTTPARFAD